MFNRQALSFEMTKDAIPIIDLAAWFSNDAAAKNTLAKQIREICHHIGFFYVINHGISQLHCDQFIELEKTFFSLPEAEKAKIDKRLSPHFRGWEKLGSELTNHQTDFREQIDLGIDREAIANPDPYYMSLIGPNQWPNEKLIPGFREQVTEFVNQLSILSQNLLRLMSLSLGLQEDHIENVFGGEPSPYTKMIRYPKTKSGGQGVGVHKDSGFLTLLLQDDNEGLEAQTNTSHWIDVKPLKGSFVVNTGELLQLMTQNYFIATPHRVNNKSDKPRYSCAFFYSPDLTTSLSPLPIDQALVEAAKNSKRHRTEGIMASHAQLRSGSRGMENPDKPGVFGEKYWQRWVRSYPKIAAHFYPDHV